MGRVFLCPFLMKNKIKKHLIEELKYTQKLHQNRAIDLELPVNERRKNKRVSQQKELIIQSLEGKIPVKKTYLRVLKRWLKIHRMWAEYFKYYLNEIKKGKLNKKREEELKAEIKEEGGVKWHQRWVNVYQKIIKRLEAKK